MSKKSDSIAPIAPIKSTLIKGNNDSVWAKRHHCFTINNYKPSDKEDLLQLKKELTILVCQTERGEEGTDHIQGYMQFAKKDRPRRYFRAKSTVFFVQDRIKWKGKVGLRVDKACMYASKPNRGNIEDKWEIRHGWERPKAFITKFYIWEQQLINLIEETADNRTILYICGGYNTGKTVMAKHLYQEYGFIPCEGSKRHILCVAKDHVNAKGFTFLIGKASGNRMSYEALEKVKDGIFMSHFGVDGTKPVMRTHNVHCIVFANELPETERYHPDKTKIWVIRKKMLVRFIFGYEKVIEQLEAVFRGRNEVSIRDAFRLKYIWFGGP